VGFSPWPSFFFWLSSWPTFLMSPFFFSHPHFVNFRFFLKSAPTPFFEARFDLPGFVAFLFRPSRRLKTVLKLPSSWDFNLFHGRLTQALEGGSKPLSCHRIVSASNCSISSFLLCLRRAVSVWKVGENLLSTFTPNLT